MKTIMEMAKNYAKWIADTDTSISRMWLGDGENKIEIVGVGDDEPPSGDLFFPWSYAACPEKGIDLPMTTLWMSPNEWAEIESGKRTLPPPFDKDKLQLIYERKMTADEARIVVLEKELAELKIKVAKSKETI